MIVSIFENGYVSLSPSFPTVPWVHFPLSPSFPTVSTGPAQCYILIWALHATALSLSCSDIDGVIRRANATEYGLASGVFSQDINKANAKTFFHGVLVFLYCVKNNFLFRCTHMPLRPPCVLCIPLCITHVLASPSGSVCEWPPTSWDCLCEHVQQDWCGCTIRGLQAVWVRQRLGYVETKLKWKDCLHRCM